MTISYNEFIVGYQLTVCAKAFIVVKYNVN